MGELEESFVCIKVLYTRNKTFLSATHVDTTFKRSIDLVHLLMKEVVSGMRQFGVNKFSFTNDWNMCAI